MDLAVLEPFGADRAHLWQGASDLQPEEAKLCSSLRLRGFAHRLCGCSLARSGPACKYVGSVFGVPNGRSRQENSDNHRMVPVLRHPAARGHNAQHICQRGSLQSHSRRAYDHADHQLSNRQWEASQQATAVDPAAGD